MADGRAPGPDDKETSHVKCLYMDADTLTACGEVLSQTKNGAVYNFRSHLKSTHPYELCSADLSDRCDALMQKGAVAPAPTSTTQTTLGSAFFARPASSSADTAQAAADRLNAAAAKVHPRLKKQQIAGARERFANRSGAPFAFLAGRPFARPSAASLRYLSCPTTTCTSAGV